jgi:hypothetical protein
MAEAKTQADYRKRIMAKDQFGRPWLMQIEIATGDPTGGIISAGWTDPLRTPLKYIEVPKDEFGQPLWGRCKINIAAWMRETKNGDAEWMRRLNEVGVHQYKNRFNPDKAQEDGFLTELAGPRPWPSVECLEALRTGNQYLQGKVKDEKGMTILDDEAKRLMDLRNTVLDPVPIDEDEFNMVEARRDGIGGLAEGVYGDEESEIITGTTRADFDKFVEQGKVAGIPYAKIMDNWRLHKELVEQAEVEV